MADKGLRGMGVVATEAILTACGGVFVVIGAVDVGTSEALVSKLFAGVLAVIGFGLLAAAAGFRRRRPWTGVAGTASLVAAVALASYLSLNARNEEPAWSLGFAAVAAACVVALVALVRRCPPSFSLKSASILSVAGFVLGFFQFSYAESARVRVGSTLTLSTDLMPVPGEDGAIAATVKTVNPTAAKIQSLGSLYVVEGVRLCSRSPREREHAQFRETFGDQTTVGSFSPRVAERDVETIQVGKVFDDRTYFEPGEEIVRRFAVAIPESEYDVVRLRVVMAVANGDRLRLDEVVRGPEPLRPRRDGTRGVAIAYRVSESSLVDRILHADRVVEVVWESGPRELHPQLWASARLASADGAAADRSTSYGMAFTRSTTELPLGGGELAGDARPELHKRLPAFAVIGPPGSPGKGKPGKPGSGKPGKHGKQEPGKADAGEAEPDEGDPAKVEPSPSPSPTQKPGTTSPPQPKPPPDPEKNIVEAVPPSSVAAMSGGGPPSDVGPAEAKARRAMRGKKEGSRRHASRQAVVRGGAGGSCA